MLKKISCSFLLFFIAMALASCSGWRLRGSDGDIATLSQNSIYLSGDTSQTYQLIQQKLTKKNTLTHFANAEQELALGKEQWERRSAALSRNISTAEYELSLTVNYKILDNNQQLLRGPNDAVIVRSYTYDENDIAGKDKEETLIRKDMRRAIVRQILQQLELTQR